MTAALEQLTGLQRRLKVSVPADEMIKSYEERLAKVTKTAKVAGFRPGKVPKQQLEQRYGKGILAEAASELLDSSFQAAVKEHSLNIAGRPTVTEQSELKKGEPFEYTVEFEIFPSITLPELSELQVTRYSADVTATDVDDMLEKLRDQHKDWQLVERAAKVDDQVKVDFVGTMDNEPFDGGSAEGFEFVVGVGQMLKDFDHGVQGMSAGEQRDFSVTFPSDYPEKTLAGKEANFKVTLQAVKEPVLAELNDEFADKLGIKEGGIAKLKEQIQENIVQQYKNILATHLKNEIMSKLLEVCPVEVPNALVETEIDHMQEMQRQELSRQAKQDLKDIQLPREPFQKPAKRRVSLGLLIGEVIKQYELKADQAKVRARIEQMAANFPNPEQLLNWYYSNDQMLAEVQSAVLEDQAIEKLVEVMQVADKTVSCEQASKLAEKQEQAVAAEDKDSELEKTSEDKKDQSE